ncbi:MAG: hypothetical protein KDB69_05120, partial [Acidimicrobiia bacterium]|nr:hypothetical protein [Acidimicrobiia bacterium]
MQPTEQRDQDRDEHQDDDREPRPEPVFVPRHHERCDHDDRDATQEPIRVHRTLGSAVPDVCVIGRPSRRHACIISVISDSTMAEVRRACRSIANWGHGASVPARRRG